MCKKKQMKAGDIALLSLQHGSLSRMFPQCSTLFQLDN